MNRSRYLTIFAVSLYVVFFLIAFWSALPSSFTGSAGGYASIIEQQLAGYDLATGTTPGVPAIRRVQPVLGIE